VYPEEIIHTIRGHDLTASLSVSDSLKVLCPAMRAMPRH
jgi:hypothetical protein